jgi:hypothetical protein
MGGRPFARIYYADLQRDYPDIWFDHGALGAWVRLLAIADQSWPVPGELPSSVRKADVKRLADASLIVLEGHGRYRIKGYEKERVARQEHASAAAQGKYGSIPPSSAPGTPPGNNRADPNSSTSSITRSNGVREEPRTRPQARRNTVETDEHLRLYASAIAAKYDPEKP